MLSCLRRMFETRRHAISPATSVRILAPVAASSALCSVSLAAAVPRLVSRLPGQLDEVDVTESAVVTAAYNGHLAVVKYVVQPCSPAAAHAVSGNHRDAPRSHAHNCPPPPSSATDACVPAAA